MNRFERLEKEVDLKEFSQGYNLIEIMEGDLWVLEEIGDVSIKLHFLESLSSTHDGKEELFKVETLFVVHGYGGYLREMRHTYFGDESGYMFYLNKTRLIKALEYCEKYFDMR